MVSEHGPEINTYIPVGTDSSTVSPELLLVEQTGRGNDQSSKSRGPSHDDPQEKFRRQKPKYFSGTTDPMAAESWIKSMEVIFEYLQMPHLDRPRCAIYMLRDDAMIWWEGAKLSVDLANCFSMLVTCSSDIVKSDFFPSQICFPHLKSVSYLNTIFYSQICFPASDVEPEDKSVSR
ncbi:hypothetical protein F511_41145 [Dorcoceras hygrometricum]|uniref:Retrotransposon gag domain-containing protein n=1 Tax=Dorcoceras hygrometricum TaxID=472368 RepID=A0A2Z6ZZK0_9LAMI|nr:hypothetical protein F511_41145 [Dorcoceras hygrometricum]